MAQPAPISVPKGYQRLGAFPLDASSVFATLAELETYAATNGTAYAGQVCAVSGTGKVYVVQSDKSLMEMGAGSGGGTGGAITVSKVLTDGSYTGAITNVTGLRFDDDSGFDVVDLGNGNAKVQMNSTFKFWEVNGQPGLTAQGLDTANFIAGSGMTITADSENNSLTFSATSGGGGGEVEVVFANTPPDPALYKIWVNTLNARVFYSFNSEVWVESATTIQTTGFTGVPIIITGQIFTAKVGDGFLAMPALLDGAVRPVTSWSATGLPAGLSIEEATGKISGIPEDSGVFSVTLTGVGPGGQDEETVTFTIAVGAPSIVEGQVFDFKVGVSNSYPILVNDLQDRPITNWSRTATSGSGTIIDPNATTGVLASTPTQAGNRTSTIRAAGPGGEDSKTIELRIAVGVPDIRADNATFAGRNGISYPGKFIKAAACMTFPDDTSSRPVSLFLTDTGRVETRINPVSIPNNYAISKIASGFAHQLLLLDNGTVVGQRSSSIANANGQVAATPPIGLAGVVEVAAGRSFSLALKSDGTVVAWGDATHVQGTSHQNNNFGQMDVPEGLTEVIAISAGFGHALALKSNGTVVAWGLNTWGQISVPESLTGVIAIAAGSEHSLALKSDGTVVGWGGNRYGQTNIPGNLTDVVEISTSHEHSLALKSDGTVVAWGRSIYSSLSVPSGLSDVVSISAGYFQNHAVKSDGSVVGFGNNASSIAIPSLISLLVVNNTSRPVETASVQGLPSGLSFSSETGLITGAPTVTGEFPISVTASGSGGEATPETATFLIAGTPIP